MTPASRLRLALIAALVLGTACVPMSPRKAPASRDDTAAAANVQLGIAYLQQGDLAMAQSKLARALKENPHDANVYSALGLLHERLGDPKKADENYREAVRLAPANADIENNYAVFLCRSGNTTEGARRFLLAAHNPLYRTPEVAYTNAGVCLRGAKLYPDAEKSFLDALGLRPSYAEALLQLGELYLETNRVPEARQRVDRFLDNFPPTPEILWLGVRVARAGGDPKGAERFARTLRMEFPDSNLARQIAESGRGG